MFLLDIAKCNRTKQTRNNKKVNVIMKVIRNNNGCWKLCWMYSKKCNTGTRDANFNFEHLGPI